MAKLVQPTNNAKARKNYTLMVLQVISTKGNNIPIIALTANDTEEDRDACRLAGMDEFLAKPIHKDKLQDILQRFINSREDTVS